MENNNNNKADKKNNKSTWFIIFGCIFASSAFVTPILAFFISEKFQIAEFGSEITLRNYILELGPLGDFIAGTTVPFLTFASFIILIGTMFMQKQELEFTREELHATQKTLNEQSDTMFLQRFENTFFELISLHNDIVRSLSIKYNSHYNMSDFRIETAEVHGRSVFPLLREELYSKISWDIYQNDINGLHQLHINIREGYYNFFQKYKPDFGHYFRNLFRFIKFIDEFEFNKIDEIDNKIKSDYIDIVRAQFSSDELILLLFNALSKYGEPFMNYIIKYDLMDGLDFNDLPNPYIETLFLRIEEIKEFDKRLKDQTPFSN